MGRLNLANWKKAIYYLHRNGLKNTVYAAAERLEGRGEDYCYKEPGAKELEAQRHREWKKRPVFSILVPAYRTPIKYLEELLESVERQTYTSWELVIADATEDDSVERAVRLWEDGRRPLKDGGRLKYHRLEQNGGISENSNQALKLVGGDYVGLLDHDDVLTPDALYRMAEAIEEAPGGLSPLLLYSDEDKCNQDRTGYYEPHFKTDFNLDLLLSNNYICHFLVMERELIRTLGFRGEYNGAQDYDLVLRAVSRILKEEGRILHVPAVLYHWRCHSASTAENPQSKQYAYEAGRRALQDMADRMGWRAEAVHLKHLGYYRLCYDPELLSVRRDVGAVGGRLLCGGRLRAGAYTREGELMYEGLKKGYSGYMHRGALLQDVDAVDIRLMRLSPQCCGLFEQLAGVPYVTSEGYFDWRTLPGGTDTRALSLKLGSELRKAGYRVCWDPDWYQCEKE